MECKANKLIYMRTVNVGGPIKAHLIYNQANCAYAKNKIKEMQDDLIFPQFLI